MGRTRFFHRFERLHHIQLPFFSLTLHGRKETSAFILLLLSPEPMNQSSKFIQSILACAVVSFAPAAAKSYVLESPSGDLSVTVADNAGTLTYSIAAGSRTLVDPSPLTFSIEEKPADIRIKNTKRRKNICEHIKAPHYRQKEFTVCYNEIDLRLSGDRSVTFRAFDNGIAYRFATSAKDSLIINNESFEVRLPENLPVWLSYSTNTKNPFAMAFQSTYASDSISVAREFPAFLPATIDYGDGLKLTLTESDLEAFPGAFVQPDPAARSLKSIHAPYPKTFEAHKHRYQTYVTGTEPYIARVKGTRTYPWRVFAITTDDRQMPVNNLVYALASPSRVSPDMKIQTGKVAWDWWNDWGLKGVPFKAGINNDTYKYIIDFAADNGIEYIVLDEGWYDSSTNDMLTCVPDIDLPALIEYGKKKNVGIVLWTIFNVLDSNLEEICSHYADMGVKGFKVDFLDRDDQQAVDMTYRIADAAARHNLLLDYHGYYKPTGINRTYPNILNFEGVFGMEEAKWTDPSTDMPRYDVTFPYIRMLAGPVDFTPGAMRNGTRKNWKAIYSQPMSMGTRCHQVATYIVYDSPFTMLADAQTNYLSERETLDFITSLPVDFDRTEIIDGRMGESIVTMRQAGDSFFVGGMTDWTPRDVNVNFAFLPEGRQYKATIMKDGVNADRIGEDYALETVTVDSRTVLPVHMASGGGFAMRIDPTGR